SLLLPPDRPKAKCVSPANPGGVRAAGWSASQGAARGVFLGLRRVDAGWIDAVGVMYLVASERRVEYANDAQRRGAAAQVMGVVLVQRIHHARSQCIPLAI